MDDYSALLVVIDQSNSIGISWLLAYTCRYLYAYWWKLMESRRQCRRIWPITLVHEVFSTNPPAIGLLNWCIKHRLIGGIIDKYWDYVEYFGCDDELVEIGIKAGLIDKISIPYVYLRMAKPGRVQEAVDKYNKMVFIKLSHNDTHYTGYDMPETRHMYAGQFYVFDVWRQIFTRTIHSIATHMRLSHMSKTELPLDVMKAKFTKPYEANCIADAEYAVKLTARMFSLHDTPEMHDKISNCIDFMLQSGAWPSLLRLAAKNTKHIIHIIP